MVFQRRNTNMIQKKITYKKNLSPNALGVMKITEINQIIAQVLFIPMLNRE
jgi:hypothetical protein